MQKFWIIIFLAITMIGCEPTSKIFVVNQKDYPIDLKVIVDTNEYYNISYVDSVYYADTLFSRINEWTANKLSSKLPVNQLSNVSYSLTIENKSTVLLEPVVPLIRIKEIIVETKPISDTLVFFGEKRNFEEFKVNNRIKTKTKYLIFYLGYTTIFEL